MATEATQGEELAAIVYVDRPPAEPEQPATTAVTASDAPKRRARLRVRHAVKKGQVIARLDIGGEGYVTTPKYTTVQVSRTTHLDLQSALVYMNVRGRCGPRDPFACSVRTDRRAPTRPAPRAGQFAHRTSTRATRRSCWTRWP